jgi:hypothetical protein
MASFGFEMLLIVFSIAALVLFLNSGTGRRRRESRGQVV